MYLSFEKMLLISISFQRFLINWPLTTFLSYAPALIAYTSVFQLKIPTDENN